MKKLLALTLALLMLAMSLVACQPSENGGESTPESTPAETPAETPVETPAETPAPELAYKSALELINQIYTSYNESASEETKLYVAGGNNNNFDTVNFEGPAAFIALEDGDYDMNLGYPAAEAAKIESAASMFNMMNVNVFNCYTIQFKSGTDVDAMIEAVKANILARQWICGAPEKLVIVKCPGDYIMVVWGAVNFGGIVDPFVQGAVAAVDGASVVVEHTFEQ